MYEPEVEVFPWPADLLGRSVGLDRIRTARSLSAKTQGRNHALSKSLLCRGGMALADVDPDVHVMSPDATLDSILLGVGMPSRSCSVVVGNSQFERRQRGLGDRKEHADDNPVSRHRARPPEAVLPVRPTRRIDPVAALVHLPARRELGKRNDRRWLGYHRPNCALSGWRATDLFDYVIGARLRGFTSPLIGVAFSHEDVRDQAPSADKTATARDIGITTDADLAVDSEIVVENQWLNIVSIDNDPDAIVHVARTALPLGAFNVGGRYEAYLWRDELPPLQDRVRLARQVDATPARIELEGALAQFAAGESVAVSDDALLELSLVVHAVELEDQVTPGTHPPRPARSLLRRPANRLTDRHIAGSSA